MFAVFVKGPPATIKFYKAQAESSSYTLSNTYDTPLDLLYNWGCDDLVISKDDSALAYASTLYLQQKIEAINISPTSFGEVLMSTSYTGTGNYQINIKIIAISDDRKYFVTGGKGDENKIFREVVYYSSTRNKPSYSSQAVGSVYEVDISPDGRLFSTAAKGVHAQVFDEGINYELFGTS